MRRQLPLIAGHVLAGARLVRALPSLLRTPVSPAEARGALARRLMERETAFLALVDARVYRQATSPYRRLLEAAPGCEFGDLERLVCREGVETALHRLFRAGVYLTVDELKGRQPVRRGGTTFQVGPGTLSRPDARVLAIERHAPERTGTGKMLHLHVVKRPAPSPSAPPERPAR